MPVAELRSALVEQVLSGTHPELKLLAAAGVLPLPPDKLIRLQIHLARDADQEVLQRSTQSLRDTEPRQLIDFINGDAEAAELAFFAAELRHPRVLEAVIRRRDVPRALLVEMAPRLEAQLQEILILRQDAIVDEPLILDALETNPELESGIRRRIQEYREHLLPRQRPAEVEVAEGREIADFDEPTDEEVRAAIREAAEAPADGEKDETTGLTEGQIRILPVPVRMKLSRGAPRALRSILVRDSNATVALSVLKHNALSDDEVEQISRSRQVVDDVIVEVARHRDWMSKYLIVNALVGNPRTPLNISVRLIPRLSMRDLRNLSLNRNVPHAVRTTARNLYLVKTK